MFWSPRQAKALRFYYIYKVWRRPRPDFAPVREAFYSNYWRHAADAVGAQIVDLGKGYFRIKRGRSETMARYHFVPLDSYFNKQVADDKEFCKMRLGQSQFELPESCEYDLNNLSVAFSFVEERQINGVVKPVNGSGGKGVTTGINSRSRVAQASMAASISLGIPRLLVEEEVPGESYRLLFLDGRLLHAVKRGHCTVGCDGRHRIKELVEMENKARLESQNVISLNPLTIDLEMKLTLFDQGLSLRDIPEAGTRVTVKKVSNQNSAFDQHEVTGDVHPEYQKLGHILKEDYGMRLVGVDVMSTNISEHPARSSSAVVEINIPPGLHYHELVSESLSFGSTGSSILEALL